MTVELTPEEVEILFTNINNELTAGELFLINREIVLGHYSEAEELLTCFTPSYSQIELQAWINDAAKRRNDWRKQNSK